MRLPRSSRTRLNILHPSFLVLLSLALAAPALSQTSAAPKLVPETVKISVGSGQKDKEQEESARRLHDELSGVLAAAGFAVVTEGEADATLSVSWADFSMNLSPAPNWAPMGSTHHLGVRSSGSLSLSSKDSTLFSDSFEGVNSCFINIADKKAMKDCMDKTEADVPGKVQALLTQRWPERGAVVAVLRAFNDEARAKAMTDLRQRLQGPEGASAAALMVKALRAPTPAMREKAVRMVVEIKDLRTVDLLVPALEDPDAAMQSGAATVLGQLGDRKAVPPLLQLLHKGAPQAQEKAAEALGKLGATEAVEPLVQALDGGSLGTQVAAAKALGRLKDARGREPLLAALREGHPDVRQAAAVGLGDMADRSTLPALVTALRDESTGTREAAAIALGKLGDPAAMEPLLAGLKDPVVEVRAAVATGLGHLGGAGSAAQLISLLQDPAGKVRAASATALGMLRPPESVKPLVKVFEKDKDVSVRIAAVHALRQFQHPDAAKAVNKAKKDRYWDVRQAALQTAQN